MAEARTNGSWRLLSGAPLVLEWPDFFSRSECERLLRYGRTLRKAVESPSPEHEDMMKLLSCTGLAYGYHGFSRIYYLPGGKKLRADFDPSHESVDPCDAALLQRMEDALADALDSPAHEDEVQRVLNWTPPTPPGDPDASSSSAGDAFLESGLHVDTSDEHTRRFATAILYLNDLFPGESGLTVFPAACPLDLPEEAGVEVSPTATFLAGQQLLKAGIRHTYEDVPSEDIPAVSRLLKRAAKLTARADAATTGTAVGAKGEGLAVRPCAGRLILFFTRDGKTHNSEDAYSWHGGGRVLGSREGKWTLQTFKEVPLDIGDIGHASFTNWVRARWTKLAKLERNLDDNVFRRPEEAFARAVSSVSCVGSKKMSSSRSLLSNWEEQLSVGWGKRGLGIWTEAALPRCTLLFTESPFFSIVHDVAPETRGIYTLAAVASNLADAHIAGSGLHPRTLDDDTTQMREVLEQLMSTVVGIPMSHAAATFASQFGVEATDAANMAMVLCSVSMERVPEIVRLALCIIHNAFSSSGRASHLFRFTSLLNHSCDPNVRVTFATDGRTAFATALRDIEANEELVVSYLPVDELSESAQWDVAQRRYYLKVEKGFDCFCRQCVSDLSLASSVEYSICWRSTELLQLIFIGLDVSFGVEAASDLDLTLEALAEDDLDHYNGSVHVCLRHVQSSAMLARVLLPPEVAHVAEQALGLAKFYRARRSLVVRMSHSS